MKCTIVLVTVLGLLLIGGSVIAQTSEKVWSPGIEANFQVRGFIPAIVVPSMAGGVILPMSSDIGLGIGINFSSFRINSPVSFKQNFLGVYGKIKTRTFDVFEVNWEASSLTSGVSDTITEAKLKIPLPLRSLTSPGAHMYVGGDYLHEELCSSYDNSSYGFDTYGPLLGINFAFSSDKITLRSWGEGELLWSLGWMPTFVVGFNISYFP